MKPSSASCAAYLQFPLERELGLMGKTQVFTGVSRLDVELGTLGRRHLGACLSLPIRKWKGRLRRLEVWVSNGAPV